MKIELVSFYIFMMINNMIKGMLFNLNIDCILRKEISEDDNILTMSAEIDHPALAAITLETKAIIDDITHHTYSIGSIIYHDITGPINSLKPYLTKNGAIINMEELARISYRLRILLNKLL